jgi:GAF domain-containing protein
MRGISDRVRIQCRLIAESARAVTGAPRAILLLYDETTRQLVTVATPGSEIPLQQIAVNLVRRNYPGLDPLDLSYGPTVNPVVAAAFVGQRTQVNTFEEAFEDIFPTPVSAIVRGLIGITHVVSTPVGAEGRALGLIRFMVASPPSDAQQALMEAAAAQIGLTLANAELAEQTRRQLAATQAISEVARLQRNGGLEGTLESLVTCVRELTEADLAIIYLTDPGGETYSAVAESLSREGKAADFGRKSTPTRAVGIGLVGWVIAAGEAAFVPDLRRDPRTQTAHIAAPEAAIAVPMRLSGGVVGCLRLSLLGHRQFAESDLWLAQTLADEAALAVQHARELERIHDQGRHEGARAVAERVSEPVAEVLRLTANAESLSEAELRAALKAAHHTGKKV